jgi:hypothetical protein
LVLFLVWSSASAQTTQTGYVQSSAGGTATAGTFALVATAGQPSPIGQATAGQLTLFSGFIYTLDVASIAVTSPQTGNQVEIGKPFAVTWNVVGSAVANVKIELSRNNDNTFITLLNSTPHDGSENVTITSPPISDQAVIRVSDVQSGALPGTSAVFKIVEQTFSTATKPEAQPGGSAQTAYRIISVPARLTNASAQAVLEDDLGAYNDTQWRFFDYDGSFKEYANARPFEPGRGFFLIVREAGKQIDAGPGKFVGTASVTLNLVLGWNLVGNPYNFAIPVSALSLGNTDPRNFITYEGSWSTTSVSSLEPWKGYAINVTGATTLTFRPTFSGASDQPLPKAEETKLWSIQIKARCQEARDENNFAGLAEAASATWDALDLYEPPPIGEYVAVDFPHEDWAERADRYTTDFRPPAAAKEGQVWEMAVRSNINDRVDLTFDGVSTVPSELQVFLIDEGAGIAQDLRSTSRYTLFRANTAQAKRLKLVAGPAKFVENTVTALTPAPESFELSQNYPNPFWSEATSRFAGNPETMIRFGLPEKSRVSLKIFDLAGREVVALLANEEFPAGRHQRLWDGRDHLGQTVGSGVYFYRLVAGSFVKTMKLTLVR